MNAGGTECWLNTLADGLDPKYYDQYLAYGVCSRGERVGSISKNFKSVEIRTLRREINLLRDFRSLLYMVMIIKRIQPDLIVTHTFKAGILGRLAAFLFHKGSRRVIHTFHGHLLYGYFGKTMHRLVTFLELIASRLTSYFIVNGNTVADDLVQKSILKRGKYEVILPGVVSSKVLRPKIIKDEKKKLIVGWMGRFTAVKNPELVIEIASFFPQVQFVMAGEGELSKSLKKDAPKNVVIKGWTSPKDFWVGKDICLSTSRNEAAPYNLIEASSHGITLVAPKVGSIEDVLIHDFNGLLVKGDLSSYILALSLLLENDDLRTTFGRNGMNLSLEKFSVDRFLGQHKKVFEALYAI